MRRIFFCSFSSASRASCSCSSHFLRARSHPLSRSSTVGSISCKGVVPRLAEAIAARTFRSTTVRAFSAPFSARSTTRRCSQASCLACCSVTCVERWLPREARGLSWDHEDAIAATTSRSSSFSALSHTLAVRSPNSKSLASTFRKASATTRSSFQQSKMLLQLRRQEGRDRS